MAKIDFDKKFSGLSPGHLKALQNAGRQDLDLAEKKKQDAAAKKAKESNINKNINKKVQPESGVLNNKEKNIMAKSKIEAAPAGVKTMSEKEIAEEELKNAAMAIKKKREAGEKGYEWEKIDKILTEEGIKPNTPEADKFMEGWDLEQAKKSVEGKKYWGDITQTEISERGSKYETVKDLAGDKEIDNFLNSKEFREKEKLGGESGKRALAEWLYQKRQEKGYGKEDDKWDWYRAEEILDKFGDEYLDENFGQRPDKKGTEASAAEPAKEVKNLDEKEMKEKTKSPEEFLKEAREKFVKALLDKEKADKTEGKLTGVRGWLSRRFGKKEVDPDKDSKEYWENTVDKGAGDKASAVMEKNAATSEFERARQELKDALQNYRNEKLEIEEQSLRNQGLDQKTIDKHLQRYAHELMIETTVKEAANIFDLKKGEMARGASGDKSAWEWTKNTFLNVSQAYRKWPTKYKILASAGLLGGALAAGSLGGTAALAMGGLVVTGRGLQRILGGISATVSAEALMKRSQEKQYGRRLTKEMIKDKEMLGNFVKVLQEKSGALDDRMFEILGKQNFNEKKRWGLSLALGGAIGGGLGYALRQGIGLIPPGVKAAVAEHIDKVWRPQDYAAQYEQWKEQIAGHAGQLKDEAIPYYESAKDYADKVWSPWRDKVYSVLGIGQTGEGVFEMPGGGNPGGGMSGAGVESSLGGGPIKGVSGGAFNPDAAGGNAPSYYDMERPAAQGNLSGIDDELLANAKPGNIGAAPSYYDMERPAGSPDLSGADDELLANVKPAGAFPAGGGAASPDSSLDKATHIGGPVPDTYDRVSFDRATNVGSPVPEPDIKLPGAMPGGDIGSLDKATHVGSPVPDTYDRMSLDKGIGAGGPVPDTYDRPRGAGPAWVDDPQNQKIAGALGSQPSIDDRVAGAFGPQAEQLPVDNNIAGAFGPQAEQLPANNNVAGAFGPQPDSLPVDNKAAGAFGPQTETPPSDAGILGGGAVEESRARSILTPRVTETANSPFAGVEIAKRNDSVWKMLDRQLQSRYGETFTGLDAAKRTYLVDAFKDKVAENPGKFGLANIDKVQLGKNYDFGSLFENQDVVQKQFEVAGALKEAAVKNILENNKTLEDWMSAHKGQALTSEKVEEILRGGKAANLTEVVADNSSGGKIFETVSGDAVPGVEGGEIGGLTELMPTDESGKPLAGQGQSVPEKLSALPENPPKDISGRIEEIFTANETANRDALGFRNAAEYKAVRDIKVGKLLEQVPANKDEAWAIYRQEVPGRNIDLPSYGAIGPTSAKFSRLIELSKFIDSFKPGAGVKEMTVAQFLKMTGPEQLERAA